MLYAVFIIRAPGTYLSFGIYRSFMISIPFFGLMAMAATFIVTLGEIDLSFPSIAGFSGWVFAASYVGTDSFIIALVLCFGTGALLGLINGLLVTKVGIPSIVATIGTMFLWSGLVNVVTEGHGIPISTITSNPLHSLFVGEVFGKIPAQFLWFVGGSILMGVAYKRHRFGSHVLFIGDNAGQRSHDGYPRRHGEDPMLRHHGGLGGLIGRVHPQPVDFLLGDDRQRLSAHHPGRRLHRRHLGVWWQGHNDRHLRWRPDHRVLEPGIIAIGLTGFYTQFIYGLLITISVTVYALMLRRSD